jgi:hypothetical protein
MKSYYWFVKLITMNTEAVLQNGRKKSNNKPALVSGAVSAITGLLVFLVIHAVWIMPIWFILPVGLMIAVPAGMVIGHAYAVIQHRLPKRPWNFISVSILIAIILLPGTLLAELRTPMFAFSPTGPIFQMELGAAIIIFILELLLTAALTGGLIGWIIGRSVRAVSLMALAGLMFALGPGHNIPFIGGTGGVYKEWAIMGSIIIPSAFVLVEGYDWMKVHRTVESRFESTLTNDGGTER